MFTLSKPAARRSAANATRLDPFVVIAGSPVAGSIGIVDLASGETSVIPSLACGATEKPAAPTPPAEDATDAN